MHTCYLRTFTRKRNRRNQGNPRMIFVELFCVTRAIFLAHLIRCVDLNFKTFEN